MSLSGVYLDPWAHMVPPKSKISKFVWGNFQTPAPNGQDGLNKRCPPDRIYSLACSSICPDPHVPIWSVAGIVGPQSSPKPKNLEIPVWEHLLPCTKVTKNPVKKFHLLIECTV